jgi:hypothetical protein
MVLTIPVAASIFLIRRFTLSAKYRFSAESVTIDGMEDIPIVVAELSSPIVPPAIVVMV